MRTGRAVRLVLGMAVTTLALFAASARAIPVPARLPATPATTPTHFTVKTAAALPGAAYAWVQPHWSTRDGRTVVTLPTVRGSRWVQPPAWIPID